MRKKFSAEFLSDPPPPLFYNELSRMERRWPKISQTLHIEGGEGAHSGGKKSLRKTAANLRPPTLAEINIARLAFFKKEEWVVSFYPPLSLLDSKENTGSELIAHLWSHRNGFPTGLIPPPILLEGFRSHSKRL